MLLMFMHTCTYMSIRKLNLYNNNNNNNKNIRYFLFTSFQLPQTLGSKPTCPEEQSEGIAAKIQMSQIK